MGVGRMDSELFTKDDYFLDWMDTEESQTLLKFQNHTFSESMEIFVAPYKKYRPLIRLFSPVIRKWLEGQSPHQD